jgi:hypothetical protein
VRKDPSGAGRCFPDLPQLSQRTRRVRMAHQERPIDAFHWSRIPPRTSRDLLIDGVLVVVVIGDGKLVVPVDFAASITASATFGLSA